MAFGYDCSYLQTTFTAVCVIQNYTCGLVLVKPHQCTVCGAAFTRQDNLTHLKEVKDNTVVLHVGKGFGGVGLQTRC